MLAELASLAAGVIPGRMLHTRKSAHGRITCATMWSIYALLFLMGAKMGGDEALRRDLVVMGRQALLISVLCVGGSIAAAWCALRIPRLGLKRAVSLPLTLVENRTTDSTDSIRRLLRRLKLMSTSALSLLIFCFGMMMAAFDLIPHSILESDLSSWLLRLMLFCVGMGIGVDLGAFAIVREMGARVLFVPLFTMLGTAAGAAAASLLVLDMPSCLTVGAGFGYYTLSSVMITESQGAALGSVALLSNIFRELFSLLTVPLLARLVNSLAPIASAGATSMDTCLPVIIRVTGEKNGIISLFHGLVLTISVPFIVQLALRLF